MIRIMTMTGVWPESEVFNDEGLDQSLSTGKVAVYQESGLMPPETVTEN